MNSVATSAHLPRRYRLVLATLCLACGCLLGLWAAAQPFTPYGAPAFVLSVLVGLAGGGGAYRVLEWSLERAPAGPAT